MGLPATLLACGSSELERYHREIHHSRAIDTSDVAPLPDFTTYRLPDTLESGRYSMELPGGVHVAGPPLCRVVIADDVDRAFHLFTLDGRYLESWPFGRDVRGGVGSWSQFADGTIVATFLRFQERTLYTWRHGQRDTAFPLAPGLADSVARSQVVTVGDSLIIENWFAQSAPARSSDWGGMNLPLFRVFDRHGVPRRTYGRLRAFPGHYMTAALNRGMVGYAADTVWFAGAASGTLAGFPLNGPEVPEEHPLPVRRIGSPPREFETGGRIASVVHHHLSSFHVTPSGKRFLYSIVTTAEDHGYAPPTVLTFVDRASGRRMSFRTDRRVVGLSGTDEWAAMMLLSRKEEHHPARLIVGFPSPWEPEVSGGGCLNG